MTGIKAAFAGRFLWYSAKMGTIDEFDVRAIANAILHEAWGRNIAISNLKLQKLLYLCQAFYLIESRGLSLIKGDFEAWQYGPVHREAYEAFRSYGDSIITDTATRLNPVTRQKLPISPPKALEVQDVISKVVKNYGVMTPGQLVELTHAKDGPWDAVVKHASIKTNMALKISNGIIKERFKYHWFGQPQPLKGNAPNDEKILFA